MINHFLILELFKSLHRTSDKIVKAIKYLIKRTPRASAEICSRINVYDGITKSRTCSPVHHVITIIKQRRKAIIATFRTNYRGFQGFCSMRGSYISTNVGCSFPIFAFSLCWMKPRTRNRRRCTSSFGVANWIFLALYARRYKKRNRQALNDTAGKTHLIYISVHVLIYVARRLTYDEEHSRTLKS